MSLSPFVPRRNDLLGDRHPLHGSRAQWRGVGSLGGSPLGGMRAARWSNGFDPMETYTGMRGMGGMRNFAGMRGLGGLGSLGGLGTLGGRRDLLGPQLGYADLLRTGRYPDLGMGRRALDDIHLSSRLGHYGIDPLMGLDRFDGGRGRCDGRGCRDGLGCGYDRRCEHERCMYDCSRCYGNGGSSSSSSKDLKTKDIVVRGKTFKIRKSFLSESGKFEADIVKLLDKKSEDAFPNTVVEMLVDFINNESCNARSVLDLVSLNVLASSLGVKSAGEFSLNQIKKYEYDCGGLRDPELVDICVVVLLSNKVDDKLVEWLKKHLKAGERFRPMAQSTYWEAVIYRKPELEIQVAQLVGVIEKDDREEGLRIL